MAIDTVEAKIMVGIIQNGMSIRPTESKGVDGYSAQPCGRPWSELQRELSKSSDISPLFKARITKSVPSSSTRLP